MLYFSKIPQKKSYCPISLIPGKAEWVFKTSTLVRLYQVLQPFWHSYVREDQVGSVDFILTDGNETDFYSTHTLSGNLCYFRNEKHNKKKLNGDELNSRMERTEKRISDLEHRTVVIMLSE